MRGDAAEPQPMKVLVAELRELRLLSSVRMLLSWDEETYLPSGAAPNRAEQLALLARLVHERRTSSAHRDLVSSLAERSDLGADSHAIIREAKREIAQAVSIPASLVDALARTASETHAAWLSARRQNSMEPVIEPLSRLVRLTREHGSALNPARAYDGLLDLYEPGLSEPEVERLFGELRAPLTDLLERSAGLGAEIPGSIVRTLTRPRQEVLCRTLAERIGFDFTRGRLDVSNHPFCQEIGPTDIRLTVRYDESDPFRAIFALLHEAGHGLYEQGFDEAHWYGPLAEACSLGAHESQSLFWENIIGRSRAFAGYLADVIAELFPDAGPRLDEAAIFSSANRIRRSLTRVEADEVSYALHVMVRFEIERALMNGDLEVTGIPGAWNDLYRSHIGIAPEDPLSGPLQDIHWYIGSFGYFPTYVLGRIYAAELAGALSGAVGPLDLLVRDGRFGPILEWLRENVHRHGKRFTAAELLGRILGREPSARAMLDYLETKVLAIA